MSGHRRVKDISYDDDELDEYSGEYYGDEGEQGIIPNFVFLNSANAVCLQS